MKYTRIELTPKDLETLQKGGVLKEDLDPGSEYVKIVGVKTGRKRRKLFYVT